MAGDVTHHIINTGRHKLHIVESGQTQAPAVIFLHGWPEDWTAWQKVMRIASKTVRVIAVDLPGIGGSSTTSGEKAEMAQVIHDALAKLDLKKYVIVGHDIGALVAFAYARQYAIDLQGVVLMDSAIPGVAPWEKIIANPHIWHFPFHALPSLPEALVTKRQRTYFDFFFDALTKNKAAVGETARQHYAKTYDAPALHAGFDWYRAFEKDAETNRRTLPAINLPVLYIRGEAEGGDMTEYRAGLQAAGLSHVTVRRIASSGHFTLEENPEEVWRAIAAFLPDVMK